MNVENLREIFGVKTDKELGVIFNRGEKAISAWRRNGVPSSVLLAAEQKQRADQEQSRTVTSADDGYEAPPEVRDMLDTYNALDKPTRILIAGILEKMRGMTPQDQWDAAVNAMAGMATKRATTE